MKPTRPKANWLSSRWFRWVPLNSQVRVHSFLEGRDQKSGKVETIDVDFYLSIPEFRKASRLLRGMRFRKNKFGTLVPKRWKGTQIRVKLKDRTAVPG